MAWQLIGSITVTPTSSEVVVGPIEVPTYGGVEVKLRQTYPTPFRWGYGLLSYRSQNGLELGTIKVYPRLEFSNYLLGAGLRVDDNIGELIFEPRSYNLRWVLAGFPLSIEVLADLATDLPSDRYQADGFAVAGGTSLTLTQSGDLGRLTFSA
jgi:hypothetical protein